MNNTTTTKRNLALEAVFMAAILVVGTFAVTTTQSTAFAYSPKKDNKRDGSGGNDNGNTITALKCQNKGSASGFDTAVNQECENLICTHPGENATCSQEGVTSTTTSIPITPTPEPTTGTLLVTKICSICKPTASFPIQITGNNPQPSTFDLTRDSSQLVTLGPGDYRVTEGPVLLATIAFSGNCMQSVPPNSATGTISAGEHQTCTITNTFLR